METTQTNPFTVINEKLDFLISINRKEQTKKHQEEKSDTETLLDLTGAAQLLHMPTSTIHHHKKHNSLPFIKPGKRLLFRRDSLLAWLEKFNEGSLKNEPVDKMLSIRKQYTKK